MTNPSDDAESLRDALLAVGYRPILGVITCRFGGMAVTRWGVWNGLGIDDRSIDDEDPDAEADTVVDVLRLALDKITRDGA